MADEREVGRLLAAIKDKYEGAMVEAKVLDERCQRAYDETRQAEEARRDFVMKVRGLVTVSDFQRACPGEPRRLGQRAIASAARNEAANAMRDWVAMYPAIPDGE